MKKISILTLSFILTFTSLTKANEITEAKNLVNLQISNVKESCSGIKSNLSSILGLSTATAVSSGLGTIAAGGALATGIMKAKKDENIENLYKSVASMTYDEMLQELTQLQEEINSENKESKKLGNVRTGLLAGATLTSVVSVGTSVGATLGAKDLAQKMEKCNNDLKSLKIARGRLEALEEKSEPANKILSACSEFDKDNINKLKSISTANTIVSGIGFGTASTGAITSALANSDKVRGDDSEKGKKKEKNLNLASNILAGVTTGLSGTSTVLSAVSIDKAKKDLERAEKCENVLNSL